MQCDSPVFTSLPQPASKFPFRRRPSVSDLRLLMSTNILSAHVEAALREAMRAACDEALVVMRTDAQSGCSCPFSLHVTKRADIGVPASLLQLPRPTLDQSFLATGRAQRGL